jgi:LacI family transcriptional regulator, repressor for deo operon, udp, cdd, tsx, nupC, and nupG
VLPDETVGAASAPGPRVTIEEVAARAEVSVATVSRALRGLPNVAPSTRDRVLAAAEVLDYVADPSASRLASGATRTIGMVVPMLGQWYYASAFAGLEGVLVAAGYDLLPFTTSGPGGIDRFLEVLPFRKRTDGLVVIDATMTAAQLDRVVAEAGEVVTIGTTCAGASSIRIDDVAASRLAVGHLSGLGHKRIAMIGGMDDDPFGFRVPVDRYRGYLEALDAADLVPEPRLSVPGNFSLDGGAEAMHELLHLDDPPTAVFALSDEMAIGAIQVARDAGLRVPEDLSVVGFDDHDVSAYIGLTTVRQDVQHLGERAADVLLAGFRGQRSSPLHEVAPTRLVVRRTTGPPRKRRRRVRTAAR